MIEMRWARIEASDTRDVTYLTSRAGVFKLQYRYLIVSVNAARTLELVGWSEWEDVKITEPRRMDEQDH